MNIIKGFNIGTELQQKVQTTFLFCHVEVKWKSHSKSRCDSGSRPLFPQTVAVCVCVCCQRADRSKTNSYVYTKSRHFILKKKDVQNIYAPKKVTIFKNRQ